MTLKYQNEKNLKFNIFMAIISLCLFITFYYLSGQTDIMPRKIAYYFVCGLMAFSLYKKATAVLGWETFIVEITEEKIITEISGKKTGLLFNDIKEIFIVGDKNPSVRINLKDSSHITLPGKNLNINKIELEKELLSFTGNYPGILIYENNKILRRQESEVSSHNN